MNGKNMAVTGIVVILILSTPTLVCSDNEGTGSTDASDSNNPPTVDSPGSTGELKDPENDRFKELEMPAPQEKKPNRLVAWWKLDEADGNDVADSSGNGCLGTLRLVLSGTLSRSTVLMAKYLGIMLSLGVSLLLGLMIHLLIVGSAPDVQLGLHQWFRIGTLIVLSIVCISVFVWLGLLVSCRVHLENHSMVILLLVWVGLVFLVPSFGRITSDMFSPAPSHTERERELSDVLQDVSDECSAGKFGENAGNWNSYNDNPPAAAKYHQARGRAKNQVMERHFNQLVDQVETGRRLTALSPRVLYQRAAESIAGVGVSQVTALYKQIKDYQNVLQEFIVSQDARDPGSNHLFFPFPSERIIGLWEPISQKSVDFDTVPQFRERPLALGRALILIIWDMGVLVLLNIVLFVATYVSFLRYDVR